MSLAPPKPGETKALGFRDSLKLNAYQETIDAVKKRIKILEPGNATLTAEDAGKLKAYREILNMLQHGSGLSNWY